MTHREDECELTARRDWANAEGLTCDARFGHRVFMTPPYARRGAEAPSVQQEAFMELREKAAALATKRAGRCTCALMDDGMDCPWCEIYYDVLQGHPPSAHPSGSVGPRPGRPHLVVFPAQDVGSSRRSG